MAQTPKSRITVRKLEADDVGDIHVKQVTKLLRVLDKQAAPMEEARLTSIAGLNRLYLAGCKGKVVGMATLAMHRTPRFHRGYIEDLAVCERAPRIEVGKALVNKILAATKRTSIEKLMAITDPADMFAWEVYGSIGFKIVQKGVYVYTFE
jgi:N-acetylglutamate synthase-like GNAT family acetyltransferase